MEKNLKCIILILIGILIFSMTGIAQPGSYQKAAIQKTKPVFSGIHTLSIHVRDTITHDSVFLFFVDKLKLPVYYNPVKYGMRKYAGIYAGNLVLEPCGPYSDYLYASNDFRAIFFGLTFEPFESIPLAARALADRKIHHQAGDDYIYLDDSVLCGDNITISLMDRGIARINDKRKMDSLIYEMRTNEDNELGIEYVKEIKIGVKDNTNLDKWKKLISPEELTDNIIWVKSNVLDSHFIRSTIREVQSITFKVISLDKAKRYLLKNNFVLDYFDNKIGLDKRQAFGLSVFLTE